MDVAYQFITGWLEDESHKTLKPGANSSFIFYDSLKRVGRNNPSCARWVAQGGNLQRRKRNNSQMQVNLQFYLFFRMKPLIEFPVLFVPT